VKIGQYLVKVDVSLLDISYYAFSLYPIRRLNKYFSFTTPALDPLDPFEELQGPYSICFGFFVDLSCNNLFVKLYYKSEVFSKSTRQVVRHYFLSN